MGKGGWMLGLVALLVGLGVGIFWLVGGDEPQPAAVAGVRPVADGGAGAPSAAEVLPRGAEPSQAPPLPARTPSPARADEPAPRAEAALPGIEIAGRVSRPLGAPPEPELAVRARGLANRQAFEVRATLDASDRFRLEVPAGARRATLELDGARFLHLDWPPRIQLSEPRGEILLEPLLGGILVARLVPPAGMEPSSLEGSSVSLFAEGGAVNRRSAPADAEGRARFLALPVGPGYHLRHVGPGFAEAESEGGVGVRAGEEVEHELLLPREIRLAGTVVDAQGAPLAGATLELETQRVGMIWRETPAMSDAEGRFDLRGLRAGRITLGADHPLHRTGSLELGELEPGAVRSDLVLALEGGANISGRLSWPDGAPAADLWVLAEEAQGDGDGWDDTQYAARARTDAEGRFELGGLNGAPLTLRASARPRREVQERLLAAGHLEDTGLRRPILVARAEGVAPGTVGLELVLGLGATLRGRVVDEAGVPFARATVLVQRAEDELGRGISSRAVKDPEGSFELRGFAPGSYLLVASGGAGPGEAVRVELPLLGAGPLLRAPRGVRVAGRVVAAGEPVARAQVTLSKQGRDFDRSSLAWHLHGDDDKVATSDGEGRFEFESVGAGIHRAKAERWGLGSSARSTITVSAAAAPPVLLLELVHPGWIEGRLGAEVVPRSGRQVGLQERGQGVWESTSSDNEGHFKFANLAPGAYEVTLMVAEDEEFWREFETVAVEVVAGRGSEVLLSGRREPVRIRGRVLSGRHPLVEREVQAHVLSQHEARQLASAQTDDQGRFELELPCGGRTIFTFRGGGIDLRQERVVPQQPEVELLFELAAGELAGRIVGRAGEPAAHALVTLAPLVGGDWTAVRSGRADGEGRFSFQHVAPGAYLVYAGGRNLSEVPLPAGVGAEVLDSHGEGRSDPIELAAGERRTDLRLVLPRPASLRGRVRASSPLEPGQTWVSAWRADDPRPSAWHGVAVVDGLYHLGGLGPGTYLVEAQCNEPVHRSRRSTVTLAEGEELALDFELD